MDGVRVFNMSLIGTSHIKENRICQDSSISYCDETMAVAIVCDGHGGDKYFRSDRGSKFAAESTLESFKEFMGYEDEFIDELRENPDKILGQLEKNIIYRWNTQVKKDFDENPFTEEELSKLKDKDRISYEQNERIESAYGTTIIAFLYTEKYCFGLHIGDGKCVVLYEDEEFLQPIPWDDKCYMNITTSICDTKAFANFRHFFSEKLPLAVFVATDGIDDSFVSDEQLHNFYKTVIAYFKENDFETALNELNSFLPKLSAKRSGDDMSVAAILNMAALKESDGIWAEENDS